MDRYTDAVPQLRVCFMHSVQRKAEEAIRKRIMNRQVFRDNWKGNASLMNGIKRIKN